MPRFLGISQNGKRNMECAHGQLRHLLLISGAFPHPGARDSQQSLGNRCGPLLELQLQKATIKTGPIQGFDGLRSAMLVQSASVLGS